MATRLSRSEAPGLFPPPDRSHTYSIFDIGRRLGQERHTIRWLCRYLEKLISDHGFPPAFPVLRGKEITQAVTGESRWARVPVDLWFADFVPPTIAASADAADARAAADIMDQRALRLVGGKDAA